MLRPNAVRAALAAGEEVYGLFVAIPSPTLVEMVGAAGYDVAIPDAEHALVSPRVLEDMIRAAEAWERSVAARALRSHLAEHRDTPGRSRA